MPKSIPGRDKSRVGIFADLKCACDYGQKLLDLRACPDQHAHTLSGLAILAHCNFDVAAAASTACFLKGD
jgi:hypothetical protein